jgi:hypothetical protein
MSTAMKSAITESKDRQKIHIVCKNDCPGPQARAKIRGEGKKTPQKLMKWFGKHKH